MKIFRTVALAATMAGVGLSLAGPALAAPLEGSYTVQIGQVDGSTKTETWNFTSCGEGCLAANGNRYEKSPDSHNYFYRGDHPCLWMITPDDLNGIVQCAIDEPMRPIRLSKN